MIQPKCFLCLLVLFALTLASNREARAQTIVKPNWPAPRQLDADRLSVAGLRVLRSSHCTMVTDLPASPEVDEIPQLIDAGMKAWTNDFGLLPKELKSWRMRLYLIGERSRFDAHRLMPKNDQFPHGYALGYEVWLYDQPTDYYRRHLALHEVTHALMMTQLGGCGPAWYMEGIAELYGTHVWNQPEQTLRMRTFPVSKQQAPHWGRVRLIREALQNATGQVSLPSIESLMKADNRVAMSVDTYAWLWALAKFLDTHPRYQQRWRQLSDHVLDPKFNARFLAAYASDRKALDQEWRLFLSRMAYGYDIEREAIDFQLGKPIDQLTDESHKISVAADRGWQSTGVLVEAGKAYRIEAEGRALIGRETNGDPWPCEAGGITLAYEGGRPLGELLAAIESGADAFLQPTPIGLSSVIKPKRSGTLYLRLNDAPNRLGDNQGAISATISIDSLD